MLPSQVNDQANTINKLHELLSKLEIQGILFTSLPHGNQHMFRREWEVAVQATLGPTHVLVRSESLGDIHLMILVRREMIWIMRGNLKLDEFVRN